MVKHGDTYFMMYVGVGESGHTICLATSRDLITWQKWPGNPVLRKDPSYYDVKGCWADPFLIHNPDGEGYYIFFKAHDAHQSEGYRGAIGAAFSVDFIHWKVLPPVFSPGLFIEPEVPAVYRLDNKFYLIAMTIPPVVTDRYCERIQPATPQWGDIYMVADHLLGPYRPAEGIQLTRTTDEMMMVRLLEDPQGQLVALSWWQGYEWYWKDWIKDHTITQPPCRLNDPRPVRLIPASGSGDARLVLD